MRNNVPTFGMTELRQRLLLCAGTVGSMVERAPCPDVAMYVGWAMAPAQGGRRTNVTLFGVCNEHVYHRQGIEAHLAEEGFVNANVVPYTELGNVLAMLEEARLIRVA